MKTLRHLLLATIALTVFACSDDGPTIIPVPEFTQDREIVEVGETVTFTNASMDATSYSWDFGNGQTSDLESPVHVFSSKGTFDVTMTAISSSGDSRTFTSQVTVGARFSIGIAIANISFTNADDEPWDGDGTGPDLFFGYLKATDQSFTVFDLGSDLEEGFDPVGGQLPPESQVELTNEDWDFVFIDNDKPFDDIAESELMARFTLNPVSVESTKDYSDGSGFFTIDQDGFVFQIVFQVR